MKVVLRGDVDNLGRKGDVVDVADGYARNFLVPRGLAIRASAGVVQQAEAMRRSRVAKDARDLDGARALADRLATTTVRITARAGEGGRLFGSVTNADVADAVREQLGVEVDRRRIELAEPIKTLGPAEIPLRLHPEVDAVLRLEVAGD